MYKNPARILKKFELPERYRDALANINGDDKVGAKHVGSARAPVSKNKGS